MRDEWLAAATQRRQIPTHLFHDSRYPDAGVGGGSGATANSPSSQGLTRPGQSRQQTERYPALTMIRRGMRLKGGDEGAREISARRMVGDVESVVNRPDTTGGDEEGQNMSGEKPWWRNVGMEEGL